MKEKKNTIVMLGGIGLLLGLVVTLFGDKGEGRFPGPVLPGPLLVICLLSAATFLFSYLLSPSDNKLVVYSGGSLFVFGTAALTSIFVWLIQTFLWSNV